MTIAFSLAIRPPISDDELSVETVLQNRSSLLPEAHPLATQTQLSLASLAEESFILFPASRKRLLRADYPFEVPSRIYSPSPQERFRCKLSVSGSGIRGCACPSFSRICNEQGSLQTAQDQTLYVKLAIVWRSANTSPVPHQFLAQSRAVTRFSAAFIKQCC